MNRIIILVLLALFVSNCSFISKRLENREREEYSNTNPKPVTTDDESLIQLQIKDLEKRIPTQKERELYSKLLPWFKSEEERLEFLSLNTLKQKQEWAQDNRAWHRSKNPNDEMRQLMQSNDIAIGMPMEYVLRSWGDPALKEVSGNPLYRNEKWKYVRSLSTQDGFRQEKRIVYFEAGKVVGWETD